MKALIWKELRENLKWALILMLALGAGAAQALYASSTGNDVYFNEGVTLCKKTFLIVTSFGFPAAGLFLGLLQIQPEMKRDRWAALLHRPVSRSVVFLGKAAAGVMLYLIAVVPVFSFAVWQVATPGNFGAPFLPAMMLPGIADLCSGLVYYFAALTVGLQRGVRIGARLAPLMAALYVSFFVLRTGSFALAIASILAMSAVLAIAAWGIMKSPQTFGGRPVLAKAAFLIAVYYGVCGTARLGEMIVDAIAPPPGPEYQSFAFSRSGLPLLIKYKAGVVQSVTDWEGKPVTDPKLQTDRVRNQLKYLNTFSDTVGTANPSKPEADEGDYRASNTYLWPNNPYSYPRYERWFHLKRERAYVCYLPREKKAVDRLDANGFQPLSRPIVPFPKDVSVDEIRADRFLLWDANEIRIADLAKREIKPLALPAPGPIYGTGTAYTEGEKGGSVNIFGVVLDEGIAIYGEDLKLRTVLPFTRDVTRWGAINLGFALNPERYFVWYQPNKSMDAKLARTMPSYLDEVDAKGDVVRSYELSPLPAIRFFSSWTRAFSDYLEGGIFPIGTLVYQRIGGALGSARLKEVADTCLGKDWPETRRQILRSLGVSALFAGIALVAARAMQFRWARALAWAGFVLALNLGGLLAFLLAADWPSRVSCAKCARRRPVDIETCPSCGSPWPPAPVMGTEIFDDARSSSAIGVAQ